MAPLLDTHFHLDLWKQPTIASSIEQNRIYTIAVTNTPSVYHYTQKVASASKFIRPALGLHPQLAVERQKEISLFIDLLPGTRYVGEIGLDNRRSSDFDIQKKVFSAIIKACADASNKILTVHSRQADQEVIDIIGAKFPGKVILHWFSGSLKALDQAIEAGYYFSINWAMANSASGKKLIQQMPINRILTESDGPFVERAGIPSSPLTMGLVNQTIALVRPELGDAETVKELIFSNFSSLLTLKAPTS